MAKQTKDIFELYREFFLKAQPTKEKKPSKKKKSKKKENVEILSLDELNK